ncbi:MAG: NUDIX hydrolase [Myxococcota bacterium]
MTDELARGRFLRLVRRDGWEWAERTNVTGVVVIVAQTPNNAVLLVEQPRIPVGAPVIEFPAGLAGDVDATEALATAAARELEEETGFAAETMIRVTEGPVSAGMSSESLTFFVAKGLKRVGPGGGDGSERITVHAIPRDEVDAWLVARQAEGTLVDPKVYAGLYFLDRA